MKCKALTVFAVLAILLTAVFGTAGAQSGTDPVETPTVVPTEEAEQAGARFFTHPVVLLLSAYFDQDLEEGELPAPDPDEAVVTTTPEPGDPSDTTPDPALPEEETNESESGLGPIGEEIAAYHEEGIGFGVLVKIYSMAKASQEACAAEEAAGEPTADPLVDGAEVEGTCTPVTAEELVTAIKGGEGMGALFKEYGKPAMLGVGHVKQELKKQEQQVVETPEPDSSLIDGEVTDATITGESVTDETLDGKKNGKTPKGISKQDKPQKGSPAKNNGSKK